MEQIKDMKKKLIVEFNYGEKIEIDAETIANVIAEKCDVDSHADKVSELLKNEITLFTYVWKLPWVELMPHIKCGDDHPRKICHCKEWKKGNAKISVNW